MNFPHEVHEISCPSCGNPLHTAGVTRRRKVQCPKCRETVDIGGEAKPAPRAVAAQSTGPRVEELLAEIAGLRARLERLEGLEARIAELERGIEPAAAPALPGPPAVRSPLRKRKLRWMPHTESFRDAGFSEEAAGILVHNLSAVRPHTISIRSPAGDSFARERALCFKELFERGNWTVRGPQETFAPVGEGGLILAVRSFPVPAEVTAAFIALTASGFSVVSRLDPNLESDEALLIVA